MSSLVIATSPLVRMIISSLVASIAVAVIFSIAVLGLVRAGDARRSARGGVATAYAVMAVVAILLSAGVVVYGLVLVAHKS